MKIVTGKTGTPHVTSQEFRQFAEGTVGQESYILASGENLEPELSTNNLLKIRSGMMSHHGNISCVELGTYDEVTIQNGNQGMKRIDLVVNRYSKNDETGLEENNWVVIMGAPSEDNPAAPAYTEGNLQEGDLVDDCPVFEVHLDGINVTEVKKLLSVTPDMSTLNAYLAELNSKTTETEYQITPGSGPTIRNQKIVKQDNTVYMTAGFVTTGAGGANTKYNLCTIPEDIRPDVDLPIIVPVTDGGWTNKGYATVIIGKNGQITYQMNFTFSKDMYLWLNTSYKIFQ